MRNSLLVSRVLHRCVEAAKGSDGVLYLASDRFLEHRFTNIVCRELEFLDEFARCATRRRRLVAHADLDAGDLAYLGCVLIPMLVAGVPTTYLPLPTPPELEDDESLRLAHRTWARDNEGEVASARSSARAFAVKMEVDLEARQVVRTRLERHVCAVCAVLPRELDDVGADKGLQYARMFMGSCAGGCPRTWWWEE